MGAAVCWQPGGMVAQRPGPDKSRHVPLRSRALSDPGDPDNAAGRPYGGLLAGIEAVVSEMRARGLSVHVELTGDTPLAGERLARLLVAAAWLVPRARAGGFTRAEAAAAIADAVAAVVTIGWDRRTHGAGGSVDWSVAGTGWLLALVALSRPAWEWVSRGAARLRRAHHLDHSPFRREPAEPGAARVDRLCAECGLACVRRPAADLAHPGWNGRTPCTAGEPVSGRKGRRGRGTGGPAAEARSTHVQAGQHPLNWTCTIEPSRTGTSLLSPSHGSPPGF